MNKCIFMGRLTKDPEVRTVNEKTVARFTLAVDRRFKTDTASADFLSFTAWGKLAEFTETYLRKGTKIIAVGRAENHNYTDKDGVKRYEIQFTADEIEFAESKGASGSADPSQRDSSFVDVPDDADEFLPFA